MTVFAEPRVLQLTTAGAKGGIVATGSVCLLNHEGRSVWLHNVQCAPEASTNLLSVSAGIRDGLTVAVNDSGAYARVEGANGWHYGVQELHGLYNMRGIFPTTTPVVCQTCIKSLVIDTPSPKLKHICKLRQLWHERLGHPGKAASERFTREPLCTGVPMSPDTMCPV